MHMLMHLLLLSQLGHPTSVKPVDPAGFVALAQRPTDNDLLCGNYSRHEWIVRRNGDSVEVSDSLPAVEPSERLPFTIAPTREQAGVRHVKRVIDGWLVGFDAGEFGGGLWWFSTKGDKSVRISPSDDSFSPKDIFHAENVQGFDLFDGDVLVFMRLDHMGGHSGSIFRLVRQSGVWKLALLGTLDGTPVAWLTDKDRIVVVTGGAIWEKTRKTAFHVWYSLQAQSLYPGSIVRASDGTLFVGMRRYVLRLAATNDQIIETWLVKADCVHAHVEDFECVCDK